MSRLFWFALGATAGVAYATRTIHEARLDLAPGIEREDASPMATATEPNDVRSRLATAIATQAQRLGEMIQQRGEMFAQTIRAQNEVLPPIPRMPTMYGEPAATTFAPQVNQGLEMNR